MIHLKSPEELQSLRQVGQLLLAVHREIRPLIQPGVTTRMLDQRIGKLLEEHQAESVFLNHPGPVCSFPTVSAISVNEELIHGIPSERELRSGDLVTVDIGCRRDGWCGDSAWTWPVGELSEDSTTLLETGWQLMRMIQDRLSRLTCWRELQEAVAEFLNSTPFNLIDEVRGHGIGRELHEDPQIHLQRGLLDQRDLELQPGLVFTIEPVLSVGEINPWHCSQGWTVETLDGEPGVHFEIMVAVTSSGLEIFTDFFTFCGEFPANGIPDT